MVRENICLAKRRRHRHRPRDGPRAARSREIERGRERERGLILLNLHQTAASPALPTCWTRDFGLGSKTHTEYRHNLVVAIVVELLLTSYAGCPARVARAAGADGAC